jgi:hypothetical protein
MSVWIYEWVCDDTVHSTKEGVRVGKGKEFGELGGNGREGGGFERGGVRGSTSGSKTRRVCGTG